MSAVSPLIRARGGKSPTLYPWAVDKSLKGEPVIFTNKVSDLAAFLNFHVQELDQVLEYLVHQTMAEIEVTSAFMCALNRHNRVDLIAHCGLEEHILDAFPTDLTLFDRFPLTDSLRNRKTVWIDSLPDWGGDYPSIKDAVIPSGVKTFFSISIERDNTPVAVMGFFAAPSLDYNEDIEAFLLTVSNLVSLNFFRHSKSLENTIKPRVRLISNSEVLSLAGLTERQTLILKMMSDEYTNLMISEILGYSESTIRQESIRIYAKLNCNGRKRAAQLYKAQVTNP